LDSTDAPIIDNAKKASNFVVWLFAVVGFLAALVQIISFFSTGGSQLRVRVIPYPARIEQTLLGALDNSNDHKGSVTSYLDDEEKFFCDLTSKEGEKQKAAHDQCDRVKVAQAAVKLLRGYDGNYSYFEYQVENVGNSIAQEIRLSGRNVYNVEASGSSPDAKPLTKRKDEDFYRLPSLNPGEKSTIRVWSTDTSIDPMDTWLSTKYLPQITYEGGKASVTLYQLAPSWYADLNEFLSGMPLPLAILLVLFGAFVIGIVILLLMTIVEAVIRGKPLREVFSQQTKPKTDGPTPTAT
jgi:hypothetical protein